MILSSGPFPSRVLTANHTPPSHPSNTNKLYVLFHFIHQFGSRSAEPTEWLVLFTRNLIKMCQPHWKPAGVKPHESIKPSAAALRTQSQSHKLHQRPFNDGNATVLLSGFSFLCVSSKA